MEKSALQIARAAYQPKLPKALQGPVKAVEGAATQSVGNQEEIKALFPNTYGMPVITFEAGEAQELPAFNVGVILSGGQAPGGHNVISGLFDGVKSLNPANKLYGFILGPGGLVDHKYMEITSELMDEYRNTGGFDIIGSGRTKLEKEDQFEKGIEILRELGIKALVIIGGDDSNTNACVLAEYYAAKKYGVQVIGCPKTIDGDLKNEQIETSFGFDTACKTYSELIGNIERDCNSARKYWHFIKLMGRSASHIALECALQTQPNICLISEETSASSESQAKGCAVPSSLPEHRLESFRDPLRRPAFRWSPEAPAVSSSRILSRNRCGDGRRNHCRDRCRHSSKNHSTSDSPLCSARRCADDTIHHDADPAQTVESQD